MLRLSEGEAKGRGTASIHLGRCAEAVIGAVYLDAGFESALQLVNRLFEPVVAQTTLEGWSKDAKPPCRNGCRGARWRCPPIVLPRPEARHTSKFLWWPVMSRCCLILCWVRALRRAAEQAAAKCALEQLMQMPDIKPPVAARKAAKSPRN